MIWLEPVTLEKEVAILIEQGKQIFKQRLGFLGVYSRC